MTMEDKDFKILLPGICNAHCSFCFWEQKRCPDDWLERLDKVLSDATDDFKQLNISGGEPTLSPYLRLAMDTIRKYRHKFPKVVLTSNGARLWSTLKYMDGVVDHLNISRHHYYDMDNFAIFGNKSVPDSSALTMIITKANSMGIDVTLNTMVNPSYVYDDVLRFVTFAKMVGASYLVFRHDYNQGLRRSDFEKSVDGKVVYSHSCPVCRTNVRIIDGMYVSWKYGVMEPSDTMDDFEVVFGQDGVLSLDYQGTKPFNFKGGNYEIQSTLC